MRENVERYLRERSDKWSEETRCKYSRILRLVASELPAAGEVTSEILESWLDSRRTWGPSQRHIAVYALRAFFGWLVGPAASPAHKLRRPRRTRRPQPTLTESQAQRVLAAIDTATPKGKRDLAILCLMLDQGLRASEVCQLRLRDLLLDERAFHVKQKGGRWRTGAISPYTQSAIAAWIACRDGLALASTDTLFCSVGGNTPGRPLTREGLFRLVRTLGKRAGISGLHPHMFRRGMAVMMARHGAPQRIIELSGGWEDPEQVTTYTQGLSPKDADPWFPTRSLMEF